MERQQLSSLTATRGFAALLVVIFHFGLNCFPFSEWQRFFSKGNLAVSYFFTLSGFIMCYTYAQRKITFREFMVKRLGRILPVYLLGLLLAVMFDVYYASAGHKPLGSRFAIDTFMNALLIQSYFPGHALSVNSPGWSLSVEMFFYLLFPLLLLWYKGSTRSFIVCAAVFYVISQVAHLWMIQFWQVHKQPAMHEFINYFPLNHLNEFILGMAGCYMMQQRGKMLQNVYPLAVMVLICLALVYVPLSKHNGLIAPLFVLFIATLAVKTPGWLSSQPLVYLGEISYSVYILQMPVFLIFSELNKHTLKLKTCLFFYLAIVFLLVVSAICYKYVEQPLRKRISNTAS